MTDTAALDKRLVYGLGIFQIFIGVGAVFGGLGLVFDPTGSNLGMSTEWLQGSPFSSFLLPGIVLLSINGLGTLAGSVFTLKRSKSAGEIAVFLGIFMMLWIIVQVFSIGLSSLLQPLYIAVGIAEAYLGRKYRHAIQGVDSQVSIAG